MGLGEQEEICFSPMTKSPTPTKTFKKTKLQHKDATKMFHYTAIADRLRTVSYSNDSHTTGVVTKVYRIQTFPLSTRAG